MRRQRAEALTEEAEALLRWHDYDEAQRLAVEVERLGVHYAAMENKPQQLMERIAAARRAGGAAAVGLAQNLAATVQDAANADKQRASEMAKQARASMAQGDWITAERIARQAQSLVPDTAFAANEDRPALVLLDIERVKRGRQAAGAGNGVDGGVVQASARRARFSRMLLQQLVNATPMFRQFTNHRWMRHGMFRPRVRRCRIVRSSAELRRQAPQWVQRIKPRRLWRAMHRHRQTMVQAKGCAGIARVWKPLRNREWTKHCKISDARMPSRENWIRRRVSSCTNT